MFTCSKHNLRQSTHYETVFMETQQSNQFLRSSYTINKFQDSLFMHAPAN